MNFDNVEPGLFHFPGQFPESPQGQATNNQTVVEQATELIETLDAALSLKPRQGMELMRIALYHLYQKVSKQEWRRLVDEVILTHPLGKICHKDPFTHRAFTKPRGYAGDAVMIDYIYGYHDENELEDAEAAIVNELSINSASTRAVRNRLSYIVNKLSTLIRQKKEPEILSVASGHCREFGMCTPLHEAKLGRFIALDQDQASLEIVQKEYAPLGVTPMPGSVATLLKNKIPKGRFDLIYALGLYDYLNQRLAQKLTQNLFYRLHEQGELILANFRPDILDIGYMESYMGWELIFRDRDEMVDLTNLIDPDDIQEQRIFMEPERNIIFLSLKRK